ncbi:MAG: hypothetical protein K9H49_04235 [Bacteroidales bacterium]|nr:hypothetical protein [Bacteroidales bacterium]MCF8390036.1 hypothetical protein [Bacteroidales bacterium]
MSKKGLSILIVAIIVVIIGIIIIDFIGNNALNRGGNPYEYNVDEYKEVDPSLIHYKETKNIALGDIIPRGMDIFKGDIYITGENFLKVIGIHGVQKLNISLEESGICVLARDEFIIAGLEQEVLIFDHMGKLINSWKPDTETTYITSLAILNNILFVADAGNRRVLKYTTEGNYLGEFEGKSESDDQHGFIIPSPHFDMVVNEFDELWIVNPGKHAIENYNEKGELRGFWASSSMNIEGFTGCCNPAEIAVLSNGSFVTSEKGMVRIKIYSQSGELESVVAAPEKFQEEGTAPDVKVDENDVVYALDFDRKLIRVFEKKLSE